MWSKLQLYYHSKVNLGIRFARPVHGARLSTLSQALPEAPVQRPRDSPIPSTSFSIATRICSSPTTVIIELFVFPTVRDISAYFTWISSHSHTLSPLGTTTGSVGTVVAGFTPGGGSGAGDLNTPSTIYIGPNGTMYILDSANYRAQRWLAGQSSGVTVAGGHGSGATLDKIGVSYGMTLDQQANIYISDNPNHRVTMWLNGNTVTGFLVRTLCNALFLRASSLFVVGGGWKWRRQRIEPAKQSARYLHRHEPDAVHRRLGQPSRRSVGEQWVAERVMDLDDVCVSV